MAAMLRFGAVFAVAVAFVAEAEDQVALDAALGGDDECAADASCALNALQLRAGQRADPAEKPAEDAGAKADESVVDDEDPEEKGKFDDTVKTIDDLPPDWNATDDEDDAGSAEEALDVDAELKAQYDHYVPVNCKMFPNAKQCMLYRRCHGPKYCVYGGYMIVPGFYAAGMESINGGNARSFDYLFYAAHGRCGGSSCVLITNPIGFRTQNQLHIHFKHLSGGGYRVKKDLERTLCGQSEGSWHYYSKCGIAKAAIFHGFPGVFSAVAGAYGGRSLFNVGIAVFSTSDCGKGQQTMVLATTDCSIEHQIA